MQNCATCSIVGTCANAQEVAKSYNTFPDNAICAFISYISELHFRAIFLNCISELYFGETFLS